MKVKFHISWVFLALNPMACFVSNFYSVLRGRNPSYLSLGVALVLIYAYLPILWDVRSNYFRIFFYPEDGLNAYTGIILFAIEWLNMSYIAVICSIGIFITFSYSKLFGNSLREIKKIGSKTYFFICVALFFSLLEYRHLFDLQKTTLAILFFLFGLSSNKFFYRNIAFIFSLMAHPIMAPMVLLGVISSAIPLGRKYLFIFFAISMAAGVFYFEVLLNLFIGYQSILPSTVIHYILIEESKFSTPEVALLVKLLKIAAILSIFITFLGYTNLKFASPLRSQSRLISLLCCFTILLSFNEISLERYYYATTVVAIFSILTNAIPWSSMRYAAVLIILNAMLHGLFTLNVIFSDRYEVYNEDYIKMQMALKAVYYPTPLLILFGEFGASNEYIKRYTQL